MGALVALVLCIFFHKGLTETPLTFNFSSFLGEYDNTVILTEGDANVGNPFLHLTKDNIGELETMSVGRAFYREPFLLWDYATEKMADFSTSFTFAIISTDETAPSCGAGFVFFLAPYGTILYSSLGAGASLGLPINSTQQNVTVPKSQYPFVAVEFDIYPNILPPVDDPRYQHVGIDVNSIRSSKTAPWNHATLSSHNYLQGDEVNTAWVSYNSTTKNLSVAFTSFVHDDPVISYLYYVVDLRQCLPDVVIVGFSAATGNQTAMHKIISWNFTSTSLEIPPPIPAYSNVSARQVVWLIIGGCIFIVGGFVWWKERETRESDRDGMITDGIKYELQNGFGPRQFTYSELAHSTSKFAEGEKLGEGGFGGVYRGFIKQLNLYIAVKRISKESRQGLKEYASELRTISRLRHRNVVQLIGWCHEKRELLLVYELMPNSSLDFHLFKAQSLLIWEVRYRIALGLASGLLYLHEEWEQCVLHRDIKSSNVMLDSNFNAKLGDFGLARLVDHGKQSQTTVLAGTMGYMAPEYITTGKASRESDVYSFGVVAMEIACGRKPIDSKFESDQISMVEWISELYAEGKVLEAADPKLCGEFDEKQMECLLIVGLWCAHFNHNIRPSIQEAIQVLNFKLPLPILPSNMSMATFAPSVSFSTLSNDTTGFEKSQTKSTFVH
ncbi:L-type lectin-domain containing receptor kinase IX.1 [Rosa chinensis]|nr:L-type lectin-domain containing receptor kinase IX.1 [Rosa chinensis]